MMRNATRVWLDVELRSFAATLSDGAIVLDAGSGVQEYAPKFNRQTYESADFEQADKRYKTSTYVCDLSAIPVEPARYDAVVLTQVLEHVPEPKAVLAELARILKPGGRIFLSAPLHYNEHEAPYDFYRYTQFGLRHLFAAVGLTVVELRWLEGYMGTIAYQLRYMSANLPRDAAAFGGGARGAARMLAFRTFGLLARHVMVPIARRSDIMVRHTGSGMPVNYMAILMKPAFDASSPTAAAA